MVKIYDSYDAEPPDVFEAMDEEQICFFYGLETDSYIEDLHFYASRLPITGRILELGCGTGRLTNRLADKNRTVYGIDISLAMLNSAREATNLFSHYICMDMTSLGFTGQFDAVIIPHNTLNLLETPEKIVNCLSGIRHRLTPESPLLLQVWVTTPKCTTGDGQSFQFQLLDYPPGGRVVKESLKKLDLNSQVMAIEERFRLRPWPGKGARGDYHSTFKICALPAEKWLQLFQLAGYQVTETSCDFTVSPYLAGISTLLTQLLSR